jgi:uncharacterized membrane protein YhiD involved in acid resistance
MLSALGVGLASGVGLYALAVFATLFLVFTLAVVELFEPRTRAFDLTVRLGEGTGDRRPQIETILRRFNIEYELRSTSETEVAYKVAAPHDIGTDMVTMALTALAPQGTGAVEWGEKVREKPQ